MVEMSNVRLEPVSDVDTVLRLEEMIGEQWGYALTPAQFAEREGKLKLQSAVANNPEKPSGLTTYVLRDLSLPKDKDLGDIVAHVETLTRKAWRLDGKDGILKKVDSSTIGFVFTFKQYRGKGYGKILLNSVNDYIDKQLGADGYSFLFSAVGEFYSQFGYSSVEVLSHFIPIKNKTVKDIGDAYVFLGYGTYDNLVELQARTLKESLIKEGKVINKDETIVALIPQKDTYYWINDKDIFNGKVLNRPVERLGAVLNGSNDHILWVHKFDEEKLSISKIFIEAQTIDKIGNFEKLIRIALKEAESFNFKGVFLWDTCLGEDATYHELALRFVASFDGAEVGKPQPRTLPAIRLHDKTPVDKIHWMENDYWTWF